MSPVRSRGYAVTAAVLLLLPVVAVRADHAIGHVAPDYTLAVGAGGGGAALDAQGRLVVAGGVTDSGPTAIVQRALPDGGASSFGPGLPYALNGYGASANGAIWLFGGCCVPGGYGDNVLRVDMATGAVTDLGALLPSGGHAGAVPVTAPDGSIYVVGGLPNSGPARTDIYRFDPATQTLSDAGVDLPTGLFSPAVAYLDGALWVFGGASWYNAAEADVYRIDLATRSVSTWRDLMPAPRDHPTAAVVDGRILIFGGQYPDGVEHDDVYVFDPTDLSFTEAPPLPSPRFDAAAIVDGGDILLVGGVLQVGSDATEEVVRYTPGLGPRDPLARPETMATYATRLPHDLVGAVAAPGLDGKILLFGGVESLDVSANPDAKDTIMEFDPATGALSTLPERLPEAVYEAMAVRDGTSVYIFGGFGPTDVYANDDTTRIVRFDLITRRAILLPIPLPEPVSRGVAFADGRGAIWILGGALGDTDAEGDVIRFVPATSEITLFDNAVDFPAGWTPSHASAVWTGEVLLGFGGSDPDLADHVTGIWSFDPVTLEVELKAANLPSKRTWTGATWDGTRAYIFGGATFYVVHDDILVYDPATDTLTTSALSLPAGVMDFAIASVGADSYLLGGSVGGAAGTRGILRYNPAGETPPAPTPAPSGLVAWWRGEDDYADSRGAHHGRAAAGDQAPTFDDGLVGRAIRFTGSDYFDVAHHADLSFGAGVPMSVELWTYIEPEEWGGSTLIAKGRQCATTDYQLVQRSGEGPRFGPNVGGVAAPSSMAAAAWTHLAGTYDGTTLRIYVDGDLAAVTTGDLGVTNTDPLMFGNPYSCNDNNNLEGLLDEVSIYDRALTADEVRRIYGAGSAGKVASDGEAVERQADEAAQDDGGTGSDASDDPEEPTYVEFGEGGGTFNGTLVPVEDRLDAYGIPLPVGATELCVTITPEGPVDIVLEFLGSPSVNDKGLGGAETVCATNPAAGGLRTLVVRPAGPQEMANARAPELGGSLSVFRYGGDVTCEPHCP